MIKIMKIKDGRKWPERHKTTIPGDSDGRRILVVAGVPKDDWMFTNSAVATPPRNNPP